MQAQNDAIRARSIEESVQDGIIQPNSASGEWYYNCVELAVPNAYGKYDLLGDQVVSGDIVLDNNGLFGLTGHNALVVGHFYSNLYSTFYVRVVEAISSGVCYGILCDERVDERDSYVYRVNTTSTKRINAVNWAIGQIGKPYKIVLSNFRNEDISSSRPNWYCSLLCYASYKSQGIDIGDQNGNTVLYPRDLVKSINISQTDIGR